MGIGAAQERLERMLLLDREARIAWVSAHAWRDPATVPQRRTSIRAVIAAALVSLATRLAPDSALPTT
jgi:hypothetical protein